MATKQAMGYNPKDFILEQRMSFPFVHLQVHSGYSIIDGKEEPDALFAKAKEYQMPALGICDLSNVFAAVKTFKAAQKHQVKPMVHLLMFQMVSFIFLRLVK